MIQGTSHRRTAARLVIAAALIPTLLGPGAPTLTVRAASRTIRVAAAADLQTIFPELARRFERDTGVAIVASLGSSGNFFAQIQNGAPFDAFMSADAEYPQKLVTSGHADAASLYEYATGRIVLWTRKDSGIDVHRGLAVLRDTQVRRIAIANPRHAPYGRAAEAALQQAHVFTAVQRKLVFGENVSQAAQLVESGNADVGIIALALALGPALSAAGASFSIPSTAHPPIVQAAVVISASRQKGAAGEFLDYLSAPATQQLLQMYGYTPQPPRHRGRAR